MGMLQSLRNRLSHGREILRHELRAGLAGIFMAETTFVRSLGLFTGFTEDLISHEGVIT